MDCSAPALRALRRFKVAPAERGCGMLNNPHAGRASYATLRHPDACMLKLAVMTSGFNDAGTCMPSGTAIIKNSMAELHISAG